MVLMPPDHFDMQLLVMLFICAVASGAITAFGVLRPAIYLSILPILLLPTAWMIAQGDWLHWVMALIILGWLMAITSQARRYGAQFEESVRLRFENEELIARLRAGENRGGGRQQRQVAFPRRGQPRPAPTRARPVAVRRRAAAASHRSAKPSRMLDHIDTSVQAMGGRTTNGRCAAVYVGTVRDYIYAS